jgi:hypothetical protein
VPWSWALGLGVLPVPCAFVQVCIAWTAMMSLLPKKEQKKRNKKRKRTCGELPYYLLDMTFDMDSTILGPRVIHF